MKKIGIIGAGFTGIMTAVQLIRKSDEAFEIIVINEKDTFSKGIAFNPYSDKHLLNVITEKMSAFPDVPGHFLDWVMERKDFNKYDRALIANSFLKRNLYGEYLSEIWDSSLQTASDKGIIITVINAVVIELEPFDNGISIWLSNDKKIKLDKCVIASGNNLPRNPEIRNKLFYETGQYFRNPWKKESVSNVKQDLPVLIIGNGLTMVDTVIGLCEQGFKDKVYSISPNGFNILPHRHNGLKYSKLTEELPDKPTLKELVDIVYKHIRIVREFGISAEPVIDSLRPFTQKLWKNLTDKEKELFMSRFRHLWGVARHRIPLQLHDRIQNLRIEGKLNIRSGKIIDIISLGENIEVEYFDRKEGKNEKLVVSRVINCTGPETNVMNLEKNFLKNCLMNGIISQDNLKLGIKTDIDTFQVIDSKGFPQPNLFTIGSNLKGELWESTAVNELRSQSEKLAEILKIKNQKADSIVDQITV